VRDARDVHRKPNIGYYSAQGTQHIYVLYIDRARALPQETHKKDANIILFPYLVASKGMVGLPVVERAQNIYYVGLPVRVP